MKMYPFTYIIKFWEEEENAVLTERGILYAPTFAEAAGQLETYYGVNDVENIQLEAFEDGPIRMTETSFERFLETYPNYKLF